MYRVLNVLKDSYITNKLIAGSGSISSNVGQAGTLDLFKIWSQTTSGSTPTIEKSRVLVKPDIATIQALTASALDISDPSFRCYLSLKDVYGGQTTPSNFTLSLLPLSKSWDEGRGSDVVAFRDLDAVNWVTASVSNGSASAWAVTGAGGAGSDYITGYEVNQTFQRGDEDLLMDVTTMVSATIAGLLPDCGWRLSYTGSLEDDNYSYFVKRFGSRHTSNQSLHPKLLVLFSDYIQDDGNQAVFGNSNTIRVYNSVRGQYANFVSGSSQVTGSNSLKLLLVSSKSVNITTSSWQQNFSASVTYTTQSFSYFSESFSASLSSTGYVPLNGYYHATVNMNPQATASLASFLGSDKTAVFQSYWTSLDGTVLYSSGAWLTFKLPEISEAVGAERNFVLNVTNLKTQYPQGQQVRFKVFVQDRNTELPAFHLPTPSKSLILNNICWRLINAYSKKVVIPFDSTYTRLSSDGVSMYFDIHMSDLDSQVVYELEFQINEHNRNYFIANEGFKFKVVP
jgi:hypothetical protein